MARQGVDDVVVGHSLEDVVAQHVADERVGSNLRGVGITLCAYEAVAIALIHHLVVLSGILDDIIVAYGAGVEAPAAVERHARIGALAALRGDQDDAVGTACTIH